MTEPPFDTVELRKKLVEFLNTTIEDPLTHTLTPVGNYKFGVYAFFDYDGEPIYVGQTNERLRVRIRRHLTNQRTDAVAMNVLDPFEVYEIEVWPLAQFEGRSTKDGEARVYLNWLENDVFTHLLSESRFNAVLNEKDPPVVSAGPFVRPPGFRARIVSDELYKLRSHSDVRIARRAETLSLLAKVISERQVQKGLRRTLLTQAKRIAWLAEQRLSEFAAQPVLKEGEDDSET